METLRHNLISERKLLRLRQQDVAERIGVPTTTYGGWERGDAEPSAMMLVELANLFNSTTDELLGRTGFDTKNCLNKMQLTIDEKQLIDLYKNLSGNQKNTLLGFVQGLLAQ